MRPSGARGTWPAPLMAIHSEIREALAVQTSKIDKREFNTGVQVGDYIEETAASGGPLRVEVYARAKLPTTHGTFDIIVFRNSLDDKEHVALLQGDVHEGTHIPIRVHSECLTGDVFSSRRCDCREQLQLALDTLGKVQHGLVFYMRQEGRGIGLGNKIRAYTLQEGGLDTFEANQHLGFDADLRDYRIAAMMLRLLKVASIDLATNNPDKVQGLESHGIKVMKRIPIIAPPNPHNQGYLESKAHSGHFLGPKRSAQ